MLLVASLSRRSQGSVIRLLRGGTFVWATSAFVTSIEWWISHVGSYGRFSTHTKRARQFHSWEQQDDLLSHELTEVGLSHDKLGYFSLLCGLKYMIFWIIFAYLRGHTIVYRFHILKRVNHSLPFFITTYYGFPILKRIHINPPSLLLYEIKWM